ncbi:hypothetical protein SNEBB_002423 [Seison nebaliae]|nr:hypothetical protein SNEBB_002423 [Seison nebaliae]
MLSDEGVVFPTTRALTTYANEETEKSFEGKLHKLDDRIKEKKKYNFILISDELNSLTLSSTKDISSIVEVNGKKILSLYLTESNEVLVKSIGLYSECESIESFKFLFETFFVGSLFMYVEENSPRNFMTPLELSTSALMKIKGNRIIQNTFPSQTIFKNRVGDCLTQFVLSKSKDQFIIIRSINVKSNTPQFFTLMQKVHNIQMKKNNDMNPIPEINPIYI